MRGLVEEREELVRELDTTHHKLHRLNYILNTILSSPQYTINTTTPTAPKRIIDLDAVITENRLMACWLIQMSCFSSFIAETWTLSQGLGGVN